MTVASVHSWMQWIMCSLVIVLLTNFKSMLSFDRSYILMHHQMFPTVSSKSWSLSRFPMCFWPWHSLIKWVIMLVLAINCSLIWILGHTLRKVITHDIVAGLVWRANNVWNLWDILTLNSCHVHLIGWHYHCSSVRVTIYNLILNVVVLDILISVSCIYHFLWKIILVQIIESVLNWKEYLGNFNITINPWDNQLVGTLFFIISNFINSFLRPILFTFSAIFRQVKLALCVRLYMWVFLFQR